MENDTELTSGFAEFSSGEWAGWQYEFSVLNGEILRVPEPLVPSEVLDWGLAPAGFEILVSEAISVADSQYKRRQLKVLPETG